ncbi:hypothetical protein AV274_2740 [Blastocystis sp. ATCC 50177/Nand II]|uniref:STEEP1 domain-containing protein n=1 Tax=Blastocystis sp. subtype 1 (strain ATCC 50177 / NandII) TaxID=478820 RepID=A0A196SHA6_BLAHN|nr:hypothetical protein AV274_2740 [Blastocystis sp. ATCC 50177/Nand II]
MESARKRMMIIQREYPDETDDIKLHNMCVCYCRYCGEYAMILRFACAEKGLERQCRLYCTHCRLVIAYRLAPPGEPSKFFYIVNGSLTTDPDIMIHEVKNYKMRIPPYVERDPEDPSNSTLLFVNVRFGKGANKIVGESQDCLIIDMKYNFEEEGKSNALLLQYLSSLLNLPLFNLSMSHEKNRLAVRVSEMDYEDFYMRLKNFL